MTIKCSDCGTVYRDEFRVTYCPHDPFITPGVARMKDLAFSLIGKKLRFVDQKTEDVYVVQSIDRMGLVTLVGLPDVSFHPEMLKVAE